MYVYLSFSSQFLNTAIQMSMSDKIELNVLSVLSDPNSDSSDSEDFDLIPIDRIDSISEQMIDNELKSNDENEKNQSFQIGQWFNDKYNTIHDYLCSFTFGTCDIHMCGRPVIKYRNDIFDTDTECDS